MGGGNTNVNYPDPSQSEIDLQKEQLELLRLQRAETEAFKPILLDQYGLEPTYGYREQTADQLNAYNTKEAQLRQRIDELRAGDPNKVDWKAVQAAQEEWRQYINSDAKKGDKYVTGYGKTTAQKEKDAAYNALLKSQNEITTLQLERQKKALAGTLPVSEGTMQRKEQEWKLFKEQMARAGNPIFGDTPEGAFSTSTAGTQALRAFSENWKLVEDQERRGELTSGAQLLNQSIGMSSGLRTNSMNEIATPDLGTAKLLPGYINALSPYQMQRQGQFQAQSMNAQTAAQREAGVMSLMGTGLGVGAGLMVLSSKKYKKGIKVADDDKALSKLRKTKMYNFRYKGEKDSSPERHGAVVENSAKEMVSPDGEHIDVVKHIGLMHSAIRALDKKVTRRAA